MTLAIAAQAPFQINQPAGREERLWELSQSLEATFLSEMLKSAGFGKARDAYGGGSGEDQFTGLLVREQANALAKSGGFNLAEAIYDSLVRGKEIES